MCGTRGVDYGSELRQAIIRFVDLREPMCASRFGVLRANFLVGFFVQLVDALDLKQWNLKLQGYDTKTSITDLSVKIGLGCVVWVLEPGPDSSPDDSVQPEKVFLASCGQYQLVINGREEVGFQHVETLLGLESCRGKVPQPLLKLTSNVHTRPLGRERHPQVLLYLRNRHCRN